MKHVINFSFIYLFIYLFIYWVWGSQCKMMYSHTSATDGRVNGPIHTPVNFSPWEKSPRSRKTGRQTRSERRAKRKKFLPLPSIEALSFSPKQANLLS